jgi:Raf kinase inhibitor-like YbhB/YbcL family protein
MRWALPAAVAIVISGCGGSSQSSTSAPPKRQLSVSSPAFTADGTLPRRYTCDGQDVSPPLRWSGVPPGTRALALVMRDPDAPGGNFIHWAIADVHPRSGSLSLAAGATPAGVVLGRNSFGSLGYRGPCPPSGAPHHYVITVDALGQSSGLRKGFSASDVDGLTVLGQATLTGLYARR